MAKILENQVQDHHRHQQHWGQDSIRKKARFLYLVLGIVLLIVYVILAKKHFFEHYGIVVPAFGLSNLTNSEDTDAVAMAKEGMLLPEVEMEGSSKKKKKKKSKKKQHKHSDDDLFTNDLACDDGSYSKRTLQRAYELPFAAMFVDTKGQNKYEASDVILVNSTAYAVCDNSWAISSFGDDLRPFSSNNVQIGDPNRESEDSGYEALFYDDGTFYVLRESVFHKHDEEYHAVIEELAITPDGNDYSVLESCSSEFAFEGDSKGFEGVLKIHDTSNELVVLGLCEGNHCSESRKFNTGHGEFVVMKKTVNETDGSCIWSTLGKLHIPSSANFKDYSAATLDHATGKVAISSQEESAIWVGQLLGRDETTGLWNIESLKFDPDQGEVYSFPKNDACETIYCNIEGKCVCASHFCIA